MSKEVATLFVFQSESNASTQYQTLQYVDGTMSCECPGWRFKKKTTATGERTCKHLRYIEAGLGNVHAVKVVEYSTVTIAPRQKQRAFMQQDLTARRPGRVFDLED